jgi:hypothetical protein
MLPRSRTLPTLFTEEQHAQFRERLGGRYTVPSDQHLPIAFQAFEIQLQDWDLAMRTVSEFLSFMEILRDFGGSFTIRDFDDTLDGEDVSDIVSGVALFGYKGGVLKATPQDAEAYSINILPIKWYQSTGTSPWRCLMQVGPYI